MNAYWMQGGSSHLRSPLHNHLLGYANGSRSAQNERGRHKQDVPKQPLRPFTQVSPFEGMTRGDENSVGGVTIWGKLAPIDESKGTMDALSFR